ncbi:hypothetical protein XENTR_v10017562 [Xenopus tropicalis]|nr:hypothetical protein XENTR_v10017562 [Xenopus tropicalis]
MVVKDIRVKMCFHSNSDNAIFILFCMPSLRMLAFRRGASKMEAGVTVYILYMYTTYTRIWSIGKRN